MSAYDHDFLEVQKRMANSVERASQALEKLSPRGGQDWGVEKMGREPQNAIKVFGFSPAGFNQVLVFIGGEPPEEIVATNPRMREILRNDDGKIYILGLKAGAN